MWAASTYRTVSEPAILVIARIIPIHLLAREWQMIETAFLLKNKTIVFQTGRPNKWKNLKEVGKRS